MRVCLSLLLLLPGMIVHAQADYPVPPGSNNRLFYIQHSGNYNTYVYDANMQDSTISVDHTLDIYRIVYTEGGKKKPLTAIQRKVAYGMDVTYLARNSFELHLAASKKLKFYLILGTNGRPIAYVTVNNRKMFLDRMWVKIKEGSFGLNVKAEYVLFTGKDFTTGEVVTEKVIP